MTPQISDILNPPRNGEVARPFMGVTEGPLVTRATTFVTRGPSTTLRWSPSPFRGGLK
jgi:hypothetical protein